MCGLEARLCRREAELELCLRDGLGAQLRDGVPKPQPTHPSRAPLEMTDDEAIRMLELTATRNRALEVEIRDLFRRVSCTPSFCSELCGLSSYFDSPVGDPLSCPVVVLFACPI